MVSYDTLEEIAKELGVGVIELCIAFSRNNPFMLLCAVVKISSAVIGTLNDPGDVFFERLLESYTMNIELNSVSLKNYMESSSIDNFLDEISLENFYNDNRNRY